MKDQRSRLMYIKYIMENRRVDCVAEEGNDG